MVMFDKLLLIMAKKYEKGHIKFANIYEIIGKIKNDVLGQVDEALIYYQKSIDVR
jgi:hypothetical protein